MTLSLGLATLIALNAITLLAQQDFQFGSVVGSSISCATNGAFLAKYLYAPNVVQMYKFAGEIFGAILALTAMGTLISLASLIFAREPAQREG